jgi:hypothetical protein
MALLTPEGTRIPANTDPWALLTDLTKLVDSQRTTISVASRAAAETIASNMGTDGRPVSDANPLLVFRSDLGLIEIKATAGWFTTAPQAYTPALTGSTTNPSIGAGSITASYSQIGKVLIGQIDVSFGAGATAGSGTFALSLPPGYTYVPVSPYVPVGQFTAAVGTSLINGFLRQGGASNSVVDMYWQPTATTQSAVNSGTFAWGSGSRMDLSFTVGVQ